MVSLDATLTTRDPAHEGVLRHAAYARGVAHLTILAPGHGPAWHVTPQLTVRPVGTRALWAYAPCALWHGLRAQHTPTLITTQDLVLTGVVGWVLRARWRRALLLPQSHSTFLDNAAWLHEKPGRVWLRRAMNLIAKRVVRAADGLRTVNHDEAARAVALGLPRDRVGVIALGSLTPAFTTPPTPDDVAAARARLGLPADAPVVLWVGHPAPFKRVPLLLAAFARVRATLPGARLLILGDLARSADDLPALAARQRIADAVIFHPPMPHDDLPPLMALGTVFALPSAYEGVPRVVVEAAALGVPTVAYDVPGPRAFITHGVSGVLVPDGDVTAFAVALLALLTDAPRRHALGQAAQAHALAGYRASTTTARILALWGHIVAQGRRRARKIPH